MQRRRWLCRATVGTGCSGRRPSIAATMLPQTDAPNMRTHKHQSCLPTDTKAASPQTPKPPHFSSDLMVWRGPSTSRKPSQKLVRKVGLFM